MKTDATVREFVDRAQRVLGSVARPVALHEPIFRGNEWQYVRDCLDTGWVSYLGAYVDRFERQLAELTGARAAIATTNGTVALQLACRLVGVVPGDEVLLPALTFVATANAVVHAGGTPHLVDVDPTTLAVDPVKLDAYLAATTRREEYGSINLRTGHMIRALIVVHVFGHPADMDPIREVAQRYGLVLIEDAAESLGSTYKGAHTGGLGRIGVLSFNGNKLVTTGGGGAIITQDEDLARRARHLTTTAKKPHRWEFDHDELGYNFRMPNVNAAIGCAQLEQLEPFLRAKRALADAYLTAFADSDAGTIFRERPFARSNYWLNTLVLASPDLALRDSVLEAMHAEGIRARPVWRLMHRLAMYASVPRMDLSAAEALEARLVNLPSGVALGDMAPSG